MTPEQLATIQARADAAAQWPVRNIADVDRADLLALFRSQQAQIERVEALADDLDDIRVAQSGWPSMKSHTANLIRAALTATEGEA